MCALFGFVLDSEQKDRLDADRRYLLGSGRLVEKMRMVSTAHALAVT
jgi:hypothetical protein